MPIYEYKCQKCGAHFETITTSAAETEPVPCTECGSKKTEKQMSAGGFRVSSGGGVSFSGSGGCGSSKFG